MRHIEQTYCTAIRTLIEIKLVIDVANRIASRAYWVHAGNRVVIRVL